MISLGSLGGAGGAQSGSGPRMTMRQVNHNSHVRPLQRRVIGHNCTTLRRCRSRTRHNLFLRCALRALEYLPVHALVECSGCDRIDRFAGVGGVASWSNQAFQNRNRQVLAGANLRPKKSALWTREFPSAISPNSLHPERPSNSWSTAPAATRARQSAGCPAQVGRRMPPSTRSGPTSIRAIAEGSPT